MLDFDKTGLKKLRLGVEQDWMLMIAFFWRKLTEYAAHPMIQKILNRLDGVDYVVAPIADNRMFQIIDSFIDGEITDIQCLHCLSATNLGNQYVFRTQQAVNQVQILRRCYLAAAERKPMFRFEVRRSKSQTTKSKLPAGNIVGKGSILRIFCYEENR